VTTRTFAHIRHDRCALTGTGLAMHASSRRRSDAQADDRGHVRNDDDARHSRILVVAMKVLVTCHARAPMTRAVGGEIAAALHADVDLIIPRVVTGGVLGWFCDAWDTTFDRDTDVAQPARNLDAYDVVVIGSPAWHGALSSPVRTYIERNRRRLRTVALFTTCGARGGERALDEMIHLFDRDPLARLVVHEPDLHSGIARSAIAAFARRIAH